MSGRVSRAPRTRCEFDGERVPENCAPNDANEASQPLGSRATIGIMPALAETPESTLAHSAELRRELGVRDLVLAQILIIVGNTWVGTAGKLGPANLAYWLPAAALFFLPLVAVVLFLNRWESLEGGLYQWAKLAFGPGVGFLVALNLGLTAIALLAGLGVDVVQSLAYVSRGSRGCAPTRLSPPSRAS